MNAPSPHNPVRLRNEIKGELSHALKVLREKGPGQVQFWLIALVIGVAAGLAAVAFRVSISQLQGWLYGADDKTLATTLGNLHWSWVIAIPVMGGLLVGIILHVMTEDGRARSVADVIWGAAMNNGRISRRAGIASAIASLITLSTGGSTGREGPVVHLAAMIASRVSDWTNASGITARDLMGCAVAAAVSASFNAPIAGALFALEVVLRHFAVHAFAPIVIASVAGTVVSRIQMGNVTEFVLPDQNLGFYVELPAFVLLGLLCGIVAYAMMKAIFFAEDVGNHIQRATGMPRWLRPATSGLMLGCIAVAFPHIIGVGYETTSRALTSDLLIWEAVVLAVVKVLAVAITVAGRMGGGVFSPALMLGALTGLVFGIVATNLFPQVSGTESIYALAGMGAVAAAVLGAPISTTLIVFELTGDWQAGIAVMVAVSIASALCSRLVDRSFFLTQLERQGVHLAAGPQDYLLSMLYARQLMQPATAVEAPVEERCKELLENGFQLSEAASLEEAMPMFARCGARFLPVVKDGSDGKVLVGVLYHLDALAAFNRALAETAREEHS